MDFLSLSSCALLVSWRLCLLPALLLSWLLLPLLLLMLFGL